MLLSVQTSFERMVTMVSIKVIRVLEGIRFVSRKKETVDIKHRPFSFEAFQSCWDIYLL